VIRETAEAVFAEKGDRLEYKVGALVEIPRACLIAGQVAKSADFFSFGTNDLTQMTFGFSRDDMGTFLPTYLAQGILKRDPFQELDAGINFSNVLSILTLYTRYTKALTFEILFFCRGRGRADQDLY